MRAAMASAPCGDDVYGEDPSVNELQRCAADLLGKPDALFVTSGTQSNLCALLAHCGRGDEYIAGQTAHTYRYEGGGAAVLGGIAPQPLPVQADGTLDLDEVAAAVKPDDVHFPRTRLLCLENTQAGRAIGLDYFDDARALCDRYGLAMHLDGARLFNAALACGVDPADYAARCDSVSICLSKGLGAPVGSLLIGSPDFIRRARRARKLLGGGLRQAGIVAAAGLYALTHNTARLRVDHDHAARIAAALAEHYGEDVRHATNMVFLDLDPGQRSALEAQLHDSGVRTRGSNRWVFHLDVSAADVARLESVIRDHRPPTAAAG